MRNDLLITAPFISRVARGKRVFLQRVDDYAVSRRLVAATPLVLELLERFAVPSFASDVSAGSGAEHIERVAETIDQLVTTGLLLPANDLRVTAPSIELELTNKCNASCVMCPRDDLRPLGSMNALTFDAVLRFIERANPPGVILQGIGEPMLHGDLIAWMSRLRTVLGKAPLMMVTNGMLLTPERLGALHSAGLDHVQWSFHSMDETRYNSIFGINGYRLARRNLEACAASFASMLSINFVVMDNNQDEIGAMREWLTQIGLAPSALRLVRCQSRGGFIDVSSISSRTRPLSVGRCLYVKKSIFIAHNGDLLPCSNDIAGEVVYGNVATDDEGELLRCWRDGILAEELRYRICQQCDHHLRNTMETSWFTQIRGLPLS